jgi:hypothetical protein
MRAPKIIPGSGKDRLPYHSINEHLGIIYNSNKLSTFVSRLGEIRHGN